MGAIVILGCAPSTGGPGMMGDPVDPEFQSDADNDTIADVHEGRAEGLDTDGDGTPDYRDVDSDGDGLPDRLEAGDADLMTPPRDTDGDAVPDFQSLDADGNGIADAEEGTDDTDGDGVLNFADRDDDNDGAMDIQELGGLPPVDTDGDGLLDFRDPDSDNDAIRDGHEAGADSDGDGTLDWHDDDSDGDGISDSVEAGDTDLASPPVDSDDDGTPDFRDLDSDNDGISDASEGMFGTSRTEADTDGDGVSDLIEIGAETDPLHPGESPLTRGDFVFVVPFEQTPSPESDTLEFRTNIQFADVYFLMDKTTSMSGEIGAMAMATQDIVDGITCDTSGVVCTVDAECAPTGEVCGLEGLCIEDPTATSCLASVWTGVGSYDGNSGSFRNLVSVQESGAVTQSNVPATANGGGAGEALFQSLACIADPAQCVSSPSAAFCTPGGIGCVSYRSEAVRIVVAITDEGDECTSCSVNTPALAAPYLNAADMRFVGIAAGVDTSPVGMPHDHLSEMSTLTGSDVDLDGDGDLDPLVFDGDGAAVVTAVTNAINAIAGGTELDVTIVASEVEGDDGDGLQFVDHLAVNVSGTGNCTMVSGTTDTNGDGFDDAFPSLRTGTPVCWDVVPATNTTVEPADAPLVFRVRLTVYGDGSPLDARTVFFLVPPVIAPASVPF